MNSISSKADPAQGSYRGSLTYEEQEAEISAQGCALMRHLEGQKTPERRLFHDPFAELFLTDDYLGEDAKPHVTAATENGWLFTLASVRERYIDDLIRDLLEKSEIEQLVQLGAGYDTRAIRLREFRDKEIRVFELDRAFIIERKKKILLDHFEYLPAHVRFLPIDFHRDELSILTDAGYNPVRKSLFVAQAFSYYLNRFAMEKLLEFVGTQRHCHLIFDYVDPLTMESVRGGSSYSDLLTGNRPFCAEPEALEDYLSIIGFQRVTSSAVLDIEKRYCGEDTLPWKDWYICSAAT